MNVFFLFLEFLFRHLNRKGGGKMREKKIALMTLRVLFILRRFKLRHYLISFFGYNVKKFKLTKTRSAQSLTRAACLKRRYVYCDGRAVFRCSKSTFLANVFSFSQRTANRSDVLIRAVLQPSHAFFCITYAGTNITKKTQGIGI